MPNKVIRYINYNSGEPYIIGATEDSLGNNIAETYATKTQLNNLLATADAMIFKGVLTTPGNIPNAPYEAGWTYKVAAANTYAGKVCEIGDLIICVRDRESGETTSNDDWMVVQTNIDNGLFKGTNTYSNGQMLLADGTVGKVKAVDIGTTITLTQGTADNTPKIKVTVGGVESTEKALNSATTSAYGVTKLTSATDSTSELLAASAKAVKAAYDLAASKTSNVGTITGVTAGAGLTGGGTSGAVTISHSNSINAITTEDLYKVKFDAQGHITGALKQNITDNTSNADVTSTDTNLITGRTLYYQLAKKGYTTNTGTVTSITLNQGDGITVSDSGTAITTSGSRTITHATPTGASATTYNGTNNAGKLMQTITTDKFGHVTGATIKTLATTSIGSASAGTAIAADDITAWTTNTPTAVTKKTVVTGATFNTVVTGGSTTDVPNIVKKTVVTEASYSGGVLTLSTGDSVTLGTAIKAYTSLTTGASGSATTGDSVTVTPGTAASLTYTSRSIPNISVTATTVATGALS